MAQILEVRKLTKIKAEIDAITKECKQAFTAWLQDRDNTELFIEYKELLAKRRVLLNRYRTFSIIYDDRKKVLNYER